MKFSHFQQRKEYQSHRLGHVKILTYSPQHNKDSSINTSEWVSQYSTNLEILLVEGKYDNKSRFELAAESLKLRADIKHQNITPLLCFQKNARKQELYAAYQNCEASLEERKIDTFKEVLKMTFHVLQALSYLQEKSCLHGDIRPDNIVYFQNEKLYKLNEMFMIDKMPKEIFLNYVKGKS